MADECDILLDSDCDTQSLNSAINELQDLYGEEAPYIKILKTYGICYQWQPTFIEAVLDAFATDNLEQFSEDELASWYSFVMFQDFHSHSALDTDCNTVAVGCTIPNEEFKSFVVCETGKITETECQLPSYDVEDEQIWKSLDRAMMALYNCNEIDDCSTDDEVSETVPCPL